MANDNKSIAHTKWNCKYHIVFAPKYRRKVFFGEKMPSRGLAPGQIESDGKSYIAIGTADGAISVTDIQLAGKKRMNVHEFLLGFRGIEGAVTVANRL